MLTTEKSSRFHHLEKKTIKEILHGINSEDALVPAAVAKAIPQIEVLVKGILKRMKEGGRLFYIGAGTSGRLGILDASECPPTFGIPENVIIGIIAGGDTAIKKAIEFAEDDTTQAVKDIDAYNINEFDSIIGIAASGTTPYVIAVLQHAKLKGALTGCIVCNLHSLVAKEADFPVEVITGPEFVTGSTRMNMISTSLMIQLGRVKGNKMVDMKLNNNKLIARAIRIIMSELKVDKNTAAGYIKKSGSVRKAIDDNKIRP